MLHVQDLPDNCFGALDAGSAGPQHDNDCRLGRRGVGRIANAQDGDEGPVVARLSEPGANRILKALDNARAGESGWERVQGTRAAEGKEAGAPPPIAAGDWGIVRARNVSSRPPPSMAGHVAGVHMMLCSGGGVQVINV
jgi:hypothetical protein